MPPSRKATRVRLKQQRERREEKREERVRSRRTVQDRLPFSSNGRFLRQFAPFGAGAGTGTTVLHPVRKSGRLVTEIDRSISRRVFECRRSCVRRLHAACASST